MTKKKLVLINDVEPYQAIGGQASFLRNLLPYLNLHFEVELLCLPQSWLRRHRIPRRLQLLVYVFLQRKRLRKADIVFSQTPEASWMATFLVSRNVFHIFHGNTNPLTTSKYWYGPYFKWVFDSFHARILSKAQRCYTVGEDRPNCRFLFQPIDVRYLKEVPVKAAGKPCFLFVGRVEAVKQVHRIITAFEIYCKTYGTSHELVICGEGVLLEECRRQAAASPFASGIRFTGKQSYDEVVGWMRNADALLMASLYEGFPMVIAEAFCCALPVISTKVGAIDKVVVSGKNGLLLPLEFQDEDYAAAMAEVVTRRKDYAAAALDGSQVFNAAHLVESILIPDFMESVTQTAAS